MDEGHDRVQGQLRAADFSPIQIGPRKILPRQPEHSAREHRGRVIVRIGVLLPAPEKHSGTEPAHGSLQNPSSLGQ